MVPKGQIVTNSVICQSYGTNLPRGPRPERTIIMTVMTMHQTNVPRNFRTIVGTSLKKDVSVASFDVAPQVILTPKRWQRRACDKCSEMPPRYVVMTGSHLKFSYTAGVGRFMLVLESLGRAHEETVVWRQV